jgi:hypothetical protein
MFGSIPTVSWSAENHAPTTACLWPPSVVGTKPSSGSALHIREVRSLDVLKKNRESADHSMLVTLSKCPVYTLCLTNGANSSSPSSTSGVEGVCHNSIFRPIPTAKCRPEGANASAVTSPRSEKWYRAIRRGTFVRIARPSSSTESKRFPRGFNASRAIFLRCAKGRVCDFELDLRSAFAILELAESHTSRGQILTPDCPLEKADNCHLV